MSTPAHNHHRGFHGGGGRGSAQRGYSGPSKSTTDKPAGKVSKFGLLYKAAGKPPSTQAFGQHVIEVLKAESSSEIAKGFDTGEPIVVDTTLLTPVRPVEGEDDFDQSIREIRNKTILTTLMKVEMNLHKKKQETHQHLLWSLEQPEVKELMESRPGYEEIRKDEYNCLRLFKFIMEASNYSSAQAAESAGRQTLESVKNMINASQLERETMNSFKLRLTHIGENLENGLISGKVAESAIKSLVDKGLTITQSMDAFETVVKSIFNDELKVLVMLDGADKSRFGQFVREIQNSANLTGGKLPATLEEVYTKSLLHIETKAPSSQPKANATKTDAKAGGNKTGGNKPTVVNKANPFDSCGNCGILGHWSSTCTRAKLEDKEARKALTAKLLAAYDAKHGTKHSEKSEVSSKSTTVLHWTDGEMLDRIRSSSSKTDV